MATGASQRYYPLVDIGRFVAAFSVMCFHYFAITQKATTGIVRIFLGYGHMGVVFFFMISGFVIFFSVTQPIKHYIIGRFVRIYPLFWFCCTLTYVVTLIAHAALPFPIYLFNLLIVNAGKTAYMVDGSYWTLTYELLFYAYIGVFVYLWGVRRVEWFFLGWLAIVCVAIVGGWEQTIVMKLLIDRAAPYFIFGGMLGLTYSTWSVSTLFEKIRRTLVLVGTILVALSLSTVLWHDGPTTNHFAMYDPIASRILIVLALVMVLAVVSSRLVLSPALLSLSRALGGMTYPLYLLHQVIGMTVLAALNTWGQFTLTSASFTIIMICISYFVYVYELPLRKKLTQILSHT